jgi:hypothetical protein
MAQNLCELIAQALGVSFSSRAWQDFTEFMRELPVKLEEAQREICSLNVTNGVIHGDGYTRERMHLEHAKLWCAMRYHPTHWESTTSLRALLAEIQTKECRYDVPLFTQHPTYYRSTPRIGTGKYEFEVHFRTN